MDVKGFMSKELIRKATWPTYIARAKRRTAVRNVQRKVGVDTGPRKLLTSLYEGDG